MEDNSVLNEDSNIEEVAALPRKSMSQPSLVDNKEHVNPVPPKKGLSGALSASDVRSIPIIETWHQNEELKGQIYSLRSEIQMNERRYLEAKEACHKSVQEVLDEYVSLKMREEELDQRTAQFASMERELQIMQAKLDDSETDFARQNEEFEQQKKAMEQRIRDLESAIPDANTTYGSLRGNIDDIMKRNDPDYTLISGYEERKIQQLEGDLFSERDKVAELENHVKSLIEENNEQSARLAHLENVHAQLEAASGNGILGSMVVPNSTFVIGNARESQNEQQIKYIDELEMKLTDAKNESERARLALVEYMNKYSKLENDLYSLKKNTTFDSSSILVGGQTAEELKSQIDKVNRQLNVLRTENRELRIRCKQLTGDNGNLSTSFASDRLMAGISSTDLASSHENETGNTSMRMLPRESELDALEESKLPLMDTSAAVRMKNEFASAYDEFEQLKEQLNNPHDTLESSFNSSMPPPDRDATKSFLSQKGFKNSPSVSLKPLQLQKIHEISGSADQIQDNSFSTKTASPHPMQPILQDMQHILDSSAVLLEGQHEASANVERMQEKMTQVRNALSRLFERLKSSAALFEEILEKMGSSSPLAERIKQMKLAFETSITDHADVSMILEAAERDLTNMSLNFSVLEKSVISQSFVADVSRRFSIAPGAEEIASSSLLNASYSPIFKFSNNMAEVERLQHEVAELKEELEKAKTRELKSPLQNSPGRLSDVQIKAAQNFEELEVCQATLKKVEAEKMNLMQDIEKLEDSHHQMMQQLDDVRNELQKAMARITEERNARTQTEEALYETKRHVESQQKASERAMMAEMENRIADACRQVEEEHLAVIENLKDELNTCLNEENALEEQMKEARDEMEKLRRRTKEAEDKVEKGSYEKQDLVQQIADLETQLEKVTIFEREATDCAGKLAAKKKEVELTKQREEVENAAVEGLERIRKEVADLSKKALKAKILKGNASSIAFVCEEICRHITREREVQHECAETMKFVNGNIEKLMKEKNALEQENEELKASVKENAPPTDPVGSVSAPKTVGSSSQKTTSNFGSPTRQLLHESTMAVDAIVQKLKKTHNLIGMSGELKETIATLILDSRAVRDFLHQKLILFKGIDMTKWKSETVDQLVEKLGQFHQDNLILDEQVKKYKKELKQMKATIPTLGLDVEQRIKQEIGGIASDMGAVKALRKK